MFSSFRRPALFTRLLQAILLCASILAIALTGCVRPPQESRLRIIVFADHSGSAANLRADLIRDTMQVVVSVPPKTRVEASTFGSDVKIAPFYSGLVPKPAAFRRAVTIALSAPTLGKGTYGAPLIKRVRERIHGSDQPTIVVLVSDCGFNDLPEMHTEAVLLAKEPSLIAVYALPATSNNSAYTKLETALQPLGNRVRIAAAADAPEAIRELQATLRAYSRGKRAR